MNKQQRLSQFISRLNLDFFNQLPGYNTILDTNSTFALTNREMPKLIGYKDKDDLTSKSYQDMSSKTKTSLKLCALH